MVSFGKISLIGDEDAIKKMLGKSLYIILFALNQNPNILSFLLIAVSFLGPFIVIIVSN